MNRVTGANVASRNGDWRRPASALTAAVLSVLLGAMGCSRTDGLGVATPTLDQFDWSVVLTNRAPAQLEREPASLFKQVASLRRVSLRYPTIPPIDEDQ
jgi:hypothetical protein